jgi:hypothetical protein
LRIYGSNVRTLTRQRSSAWFVLLTTVSLAGCAARPPRPTGTLADRHPDYVDLHPGWRVRVVIPLTKSGKYKVETSTTQTSGNTIEVKASDDLLGYEEDFYEVKPKEAGVAIRFKSATAHMVKARQPDVTSRSLTSYSFLTTCHGFGLFSLRARV